MENKELNIAAILKDKPNVKLWSPIMGECTYSNYYPSTEEIVVSFTNKYDEGSEWNFHQSGRTLSAKDTSEVCLFPSKKMRDWSKFAWKRGDVLVYIDDEELYYAIFEAFQDDEYTAFKSRYNFKEGNHWLLFNSQSSTNHFAKASNDEAKKFIKDIEEHYGGKLNLETLEIEREPKQECEFKTFDKVLVRDGDNEGWIPAIFIRISDSDMYPYECKSLCCSGEENYKQCIHYEGNEDMAFTTKPF